MNLATILVLFFIPMIIGYLVARFRQKNIRQKQLVDWSVYDTPTYLRR